MVKSAYYCKKEVAAMRKKIYRMVHIYEIATPLTQGHKVLTVTRYYKCEKEKDRGR